MRYFVLALIVVLSSNIAAAQLSIRFSVDSMKFGGVGPCVGARDSFELINVGTRTIPSPGLRLVPGFRLEAASEDNILPGERRTIYVTFVGNATVAWYLSPYIVNVTLGSESSTDTVWLSANRLPGPCCVFRIDTMRGAPGDEGAIRIIQDSTGAGVFLSDVTSNFDVRYNPTMGVIHTLPVGTQRLGAGLVRVSTQLRNDNGVIAEIPCRFVLGDDDTAALVIASRAHSDPRVIDAVYPGVLITTNICIDPITRLFDASAKAPTIISRSGGIDIAEARTGAEVMIVDVCGRVVLRTTIPADEIYSVSLANGVYLMSVGAYTTKVVVGL